MSLRIVILGAGGFVGRNLCKHLAAGQNKVLAVARNWDGRAVDLPNVACETLQTDEYGRLGEIAEDALGGFDALINCVAYGVKPSDRDAGQMVAMNVALPVELATLAARAGAVFVHFGSSAEYAQVVDRVPIAENGAPEETRLYGASKQAGTTLSLVANKQAGGRMAVLRLFNVYGPHESEHRLFPTLLRKLAEGSDVELSSGLQIRDFVHVMDVAEAVSKALNLLASSHEGFGDVFNIASGEGISVREFSQRVCAALGAPKSRLIFGSTPLRPDDLPWLVGDSSRFSHATGWRPDVNLEQAVAELTGQQGAASH